MVANRRRERNRVLGASMGIRILEQATTMIPQESRLELIDDGYGKRVLRNGQQIASDCDGDIAVLARRLVTIRDGGFNRGSVAHIGGGLCLLARMMGPGYDHTVFEIEPSLREFSPRGVTFIPGDWRDTISGTFDIVIYDLGGEVPRGTLLKHLNDGGVILPKEDL